MFGRNPVVIITAIVTILQGVGIFFFADPAYSLELLVVPLLTAFGGAAAARKTLAKETVKDAGLSPERVKADAANPTIPKHHGE